MVQKHPPFHSLCCFSMFPHTETHMDVKQLGSHTFKSIKKVEKLSKIYM